ncbi:Tetratricopeptide repeat-containing protein [Chitinophaga jiangningensis]|uniref:Tetratricopeptide repeat-containing protein n=1 Tax=Chitinophaga jiangningensis TaxID=1419482 RepID=A0A1M7AZ15_9BACT|nr:tetratricopeptide repeat protein [Chitinophaga jiangningensis]SHL47998.1 Tetratricopeptide repeat-containing protein [Chitinophaga jiangningensis]
MAETKNKATQPQTASQDFDLQASMHRAEDFYTKNKNIINIGLLAVVVVVGGFFAYNRFIKQPNETKAQEMIFQAQNSFAVDSFKVALNGNGNNYGFLQVIDKYGSTKAGNIAKYSAGVCYIRLGEYQKGIDMLKSFSSNDLMLQPAAFGLIGDAYMELNQVNDGIEFYKKAGHYNDNELTAPVYLFRAGMALRKAGKDQDAIAIFKEIKEKYPMSAEGREIDKYLAVLGDVRN